MPSRSTVNGWEHDRIDSTRGVVSGPDRFVSCVLKGNMNHEISLPRHVPEQLALYQGDHLITQEVCLFDAAQALENLQRSQRVMAIDIGGDKLRSAMYSVGDGKLTRLEEHVLRSTGGAGYLSVLERLAEESLAKGLRVGISSATKLDESTITRTVNLSQFFEEIRREYDADYRNLFPTCSFVANDTVAGICGASTLLSLQGTSAEDVAFFICASGLGASVIKDDVAIHVEAGHVPLVNALNPLGQATPCGVEGRDYVCVERVTAARAGIEDLYRQQTGEARDGITLGQMYERGDTLATVLYETSALALSHAIAGVMERYAFSNSKQSAVVLHGGNFEITRYRDQVKRNLQGIPGAGCRLVFSRDLSRNVCLDGAAVMAAYSTS